MNIEYCPLSLSQPYVCIKPVCGRTPDVCSVFIVGGARVGSRAVKRRLPTSPTQEQSSAKKKRGEGTSSSKSQCVL